MSHLLAATSLFPSLFSSYQAKGTRFARLEATRVYLSIRVQYLYVEVYLHPQQIYVRKDAAVDHACSNPLLASGGSCAIARKLRSPVKASREEHLLPRHRYFHTPSNLKLLCIQTHYDWCIRCPQTGKVSGIGPNQNGRLSKLWRLGEERRREEKTEEKRRKEEMRGWKKERKEEES